MAKQLNTKLTTFWQPLMVTPYRKPLLNSLIDGQIYNIFLEQVPCFCQYFPYGNRLWETLMETLFGNHV